MLWESRWYVVGNICCGHTLWTTKYIVWVIQVYIPWVLCCGQHEYMMWTTSYMMWVTLLSTVYINDIHSITPTVYKCIYTVGYMVWITSIQWCGWRTPYTVGVMLWTTWIYDVDNIIYGVGNIVVHSIYQWYPRHNTHGIWTDI